MIFAKVSSDNELLLFPYTFDTLKQENPNTKWSNTTLNKKNIKELYELTEDCLNNGNILVEVNTLPLPDYDEYLYNCLVDDVPTLVDGEWSFGFTLIELTDEEIQKKAADNESNITSEINVGTQPVLE